MRKRVLQVLWVILTLQIVWASTDDKEAVLKAEAAVRGAQLRNDTGALERLLADDFISINQWGVARDKRGAIQLFKTFHMTSQVVSDVTVRVSGETATVLGNMFESGRERFLFLETYVKRHGEWQLFFRRT
jgi:hypothetical protein